jgi:TonB family protein
MKTFDPPSKNIDGTLDGGSQSVVDPNGEVDFLTLYTRYQPYARRVAVRSLIPGCGQIYNGELAKGILFLSVTLANIALVASFVFANQLEPMLSSVAIALHRQPNWTLSEPLRASFVHSPALFFYIMLIAAFIAYAVRDAYDGALKVKTSGHRLPGARLTMSEATSGSYLAHLTVVVSFILAVILFVTPLRPTPQVTDISLVAPEKPKEAAPAPKHENKKPDAPKPKAVVEPKKVVEPKPVVKPQQKVEPPKPQPVAVAVPTTEPTPLSLAPVESAAPAPAPVTAPSGPPTGGSGGGAGNGNGPGGNGDAEVDMGPYMRELQKRIKAYWHPPKGNENKIKVSFKVFKDGHITKLKLTSSSGVGPADDAALEAVQDAVPFAQLPAGVGDDVDINFTFDYHVFGVGR